MRERLKKIGWILLGIYFSIAIIFLGLSYFKPTITGLIAYEESTFTKNWTFDNNNDYIYNNSLISIENGSAKLASTATYIYWNTTTETEYVISQSLYDPKDQTDKVNSLDNKKFEADEEKIFDIIFSEKLSNGDKISIYMEGDDEGKIYLCSFGGTCSSSNYGSIEFEDDEENWYNITISNLETPTKIISIVSDEEIEYNYINSTKGELVKALYDPDNKLSKVQTKDDDAAEVDEDKIFSIIFNNQISNNDIISFYLKKGDNAEIKLCNYGEICSSGYGSISFSGSEGFFNLSVNNLDEAKNAFSIIPNKDIKIDYIKAVKRVITAHESTNTSYPLLAAIETKDFSIASLFSFLNFGKNELSNNQNINYYYSTDSGISWNTVPLNNNLSDLSINNGKIKIKAELSSNAAETPVIHDFVVSYITKVCNENWNLTYGVCLSSNTKLKYYVDVNECGTKNNLPADNGSYVNCYYDNKVPNATKFLVNPRYGIPGILVNISINLTDENDIFSLAKIKDSNNNVIQTIPLKNDINGFYSTTFNTENLSIGIYTLSILANDSKNNKKEYENIGLIALMPYAKSSFTNNSINLRQNEKFYIDARNESNALIELQTNADIPDASFSVAHYITNAKNSSPDSNELGRFIDIIADNDTSQSLSSATIRIYYTDEDIINKNLDENTLKIYYFNETGNKWQILTSTVNTTGNYVEITIDHLSTFGIFGETLQSSGSSSSGGGGSGGSGGGGKTRIIQKTTEQKTEIIEEKIEIQKVDVQQIKAIEEQEVCDNKISVSLSEQISFIGSDSERGIVSNMGNCLIERIDISLDEKLKEVIALENEIINDIGINQSAEFVLVEKFEAEKASSSLIQGFNIKIPGKTVRTYDGILTFDALSQNKLEIEEKLNIKVEVEKDSVLIDILNYKNIAIAASFFILLALISGYVSYRKRKRE